jgi:hypothetical protein
VLVLYGFCFVRSFCASSCLPSCSNN